MFRSSTEVEYRVVVEITCQLTWLRYLLQHLHVYHHEPVKLFCDNQAVIYIAQNSIYRKQTKYIKLGNHIVRERIQNGEIGTIHVQTGKQLADILTKPLGHATFKFHLNKLGVHDIDTPT